MPATYSHKGKGSKDYQTAYFQRTQPQTTAKHFIGDIEVDEATYRKYNREDFKLGDGTLRNLRSVMVYANSAELAAEYPEMAKAAKKIIAEITAEITNKGENKAMSKFNNAADFMTALHDVYAESRAAYDAAAEKLAKVREYYETCEQDAKKDASANNVAHLDIARGKYQLAQDEYRTAYKNMKADFDSKCKELRSQLNEHLGERYAASPDKLDNATMQLLNAGICTASDLSRLADRHKDNPTMLRIICGYADKMYRQPHVPDEDGRILAAIKSGAGAARNGDRELKVFDGAVQLLNYGMQDNYTVATKMHTTAENKWGDYFSSMATLSGGSVETME